MFFCEFRIKVVNFKKNLLLIDAPIVDDVKISTAKEADAKSTKNDVIISVAANGSQKDEKNPMLQLANENPLGIKIKEITKPEEIRITDDKPKPFNPFKSTTTTTTTTTTTMTPTTTSAPTATPTPTTIAPESSSEAVTQSTTETTSLSSLSTETNEDSSTEDTNRASNSSDHESRDYMDDGAVNLDDTASGAPPTKASADGEVEPKVLLGSADSNSIGDDGGTKSVRQTTENTTSSEIDQSSEIGYLSSTTEILTESSTPFAEASTDSGDVLDSASLSPKNLVVVRQGGKTESFRISGTDGLQRVEELEVLNSTTENSQEDLGAVAQSSEHSIIASTENIENKSSEELAVDSSSTTSFPETFDDITVSSAIEKKLDSTLNDNSTEHLTNNSIEVSTADGFGENSSELMSSEQIFGTIYYSELKSTASPLNEEPIDTIFYGPFEDASDASSTTEGADGSSSESSYYSTTTATESSTVSVAVTKSTTIEPLETSSSRFAYEEEEITVAENPEYPYIPDDLSLHNKDVEEEEKRRLPSKVLADETVSSTVGPSNSCDDCDTAAKSVEMSSTQDPPIEDEKMEHKTDIIESRAPGEPHLIPEWERNTTEKASTTEEMTTLGPKDTTTAANEINKSAIVDLVDVVNKEISNTNKTGALTLETLPNDLSSEEKDGRKEPTTERPTTKGYENTDDIQEDSASSAQSEFQSSIMEGASPKDDAESIKLNSGGGGDDNANESYSSYEAPVIPESFQNYWRYVGQINGWPMQ